MMYVLLERKLYLHKYIQLKRIFVKIRDLMSYADYMTFFFLTWHKYCMLDDIYLIIFMEVLTR